MFKTVDPKVNFAKQERKLLDYWYEDGIVERYLKKNKDSKEKFSFLDGPITANNPMGVHHAWGRTYKDLWQRFWNMRGKKQRFQNGFDEQGLWVEVEVEKELGLRIKKDIENLIPNDKFKSLEKFINHCKERVKKYSAVQTEQSKRLGYFMDWSNSYHTSSDENNYTIWGFLKKCNENGWLYKGSDTIPWCPRCGTAISQHEIGSEEYKDFTHETIYFKLPIKDGKDEYFLVWTTTPWTIPANVALAVNKKIEYGKWKLENGDIVILAVKRAEVLGIKDEPLEKIKAENLIGLEYSAPFDDLLSVKRTLSGYTHRVIDGNDLVTEEEGTGILHVAPGAGEEDYKLAKENFFPVIAPIDEDASYFEGFGEFSGKNAKAHPEIIIDYLKQKENCRFLYKTEKITHRYPACWRCKKELVWRNVPEWYIAMDGQSNSKLKVKNSKVENRTLRERMIVVAGKINWIPKWGLSRELDWLQNMHDWLISKKRYWGLALPIWECDCGNFIVIGSREELKEKAVSGWDDFEGHSPHRPWIDLVKIKCDKCGCVASRIPDVGSPWLDAGIVPFSTMPKDWFPADFITESFPGQFRNWFYSLIAMSTVLKDTNPFKSILGFALVRDEKGEEMHKSKGNSIEFNEAADKIGVDVMRWMYARQDPEKNLNFGYLLADEIRRSFHLMLWNIYNFFVSYANIDRWQARSEKPEAASENVLDRWIISRLNQTIKTVTESLEKYDVFSGSRNIENFVNDLSVWYVRRSRERVGPSAENPLDKDECYQTLYEVLTTLSKLLAPFTPFLSEEIYKNLTGEQSVHLSTWPKTNENLIDKKLEQDMINGMEVASVINMKRKVSAVSVKIPIRELRYTGPKELPKDVLNVVLAEVNVYELKYERFSDMFTSGLGVIPNEITNPENQDLEAGIARDIIRQIQEERKKLGTKLDEKVDVQLVSWPREFEEKIKKKALVRNLRKSDKFIVSKIDE